MKYPSPRQLAIADFLARPRPLPLRCGVQHYAWGDLDYIPDLIGIPNAERQPFAELWVGAHPDLSAAARIGHCEVALNVLVKDAAEAVLGTDTAERFDRQLPFLLKILAAAQPLSIQAHPDRRQATEGFECENRLGLSTHHPRRNYHDDRHKPELITALTDVYALRGFRPFEEIDRLLDSVPEFEALAAAYQPTRASLAALYNRLMRMDQTEVDAILQPLLERLSRQHGQRAFGKQQRAYWLLRADALSSWHGHKDRGLFSVLLLNLVHLVPGEAMYIPPGELHSYLEGAGIEVMANSNNVVRGGLTRKHVDLDQLLRIVNFSAAKAEVIRPGRPPGEAGPVAYPTSSEEFVLSRLRLAANEPHECPGGRGVNLGIVTEGEALVSTTGGDYLALGRGNAFLVPNGTTYRICSAAPAVVFVASVPHRLGRRQRVDRRR